MIRSEATTVAGAVDGAQRALARWGRQPTRLLQVLREVQEQCGFVPPEVVELLSAELGLTLAQIRGVAGFYSFLALEPGGEYRVLFSDNVTDRMAGSDALLEELCRRLWVEPGRPSQDGLVSVGRTACTGLCDQGPALLVNGRPVARVTPQRLDRLCELIVARRPLAEWPAELFVVEDNIRRRDVLLTDPSLPGDAIRAVLGRGDSLAAARQATIDEIKRARLLGRGGAGFTTGVKWESCARTPGPSRVVVCNADEGEPGTFKDRVLLTRFADRVVEGMTVAAFGIDATLGFVYLRGEYRYLLESLQNVLARRRREGLLGCGILGRPGFDFDIEIHVGAGSYVCGEASAQVESLEGRRGIPRNRPPRLAQQGYLGLPTIVNNVETYCVAALIALHGADWFRARGTPRSAGTKLLSVSGDCARPGIYEYPLGVTVREVLVDCGAEDSIAVQVGGPAGVCIDAEEFSRRIAFEDIETAGAFMVFDGRRDMFEVARHFAHFFAHESCGFCTPCRVGTRLIARLMDRVHEGKGSQHDLALVEELRGLMRDASHCGLGQTAGNPVADTLQRFRPAYERRLVSLGVEPAFDLDGALARARRMTGRDDPGAHLGGPS